MSAAGPAGRCLLLLDLDGVVVFESGPPLLPSLEILRLHDGLAAALRSLDAPVVVLTHRSRREALHILDAAGLPPTALEGILAAEDLFRAGLRHGGPLGLLRHGLRKSWVLPLIERRWGVPPERIAFVDDRLDNLEDLMARGLGLALHAPSAVTGTRLVSFELAEVVRLFVAWRQGRMPDGLVALAPAASAVGPWQRTGLHTRREGRHAFNLARRLGRLARTRLQGPRTT
jgi:hypothetical protein